MRSLTFGEVNAFLRQYDLPQLRRLDFALGKCITHVHREGCAAFIALEDNSVVLLQARLHTPDPTHCDVGLNDLDFDLDAYFEFLDTYYSRYPRWFPKGMPLLHIIRHDYDALRERDAG